MTWWIYASAVAVLLGIAALIAEQSARDLGRAGRWIWLVAMGLSVGLPVVAYVGLARVIGANAVMPPMPLLTLPAIEAGAGSATSSSLALAAVWVWVSASVVVIAAVVFSALRLRSLRGAWTRGDVAGIEVWWTRDLGPAAFGLGVPAIVLPDWVHGMAERTRRLLVLHEFEHACARDPRTVFAGMVAVALMPWNPALWWMLTRLRLAVEMDCDVRVLGTSPDPLGYGQVLLEVGSRRARGGLLVAFAEPRGFLERRIRRISAGRVDHPVGRLLAASVPAALTVVLAIYLLEPMSADRPREEEKMAAQDETNEPSLADEPAFTPYTRNPQLRNDQEVLRALERDYPPLLRDAGIGGTTVLWFFIDQAGRVVNVRLHVSSGYDALDEAAVRVARVMEFTPAENRGRSVSVWVQIPVKFSAK